MSSNSRSIFRWFWAWQDEDEEAWLQEMSLQGWHLRTVNFPARYVFDRGEPCNFVYRLDFFTGRKDYRQYLQLFADAGWAHLCEYGAWQYFRIEAPVGESPEIYTDNASKVKKYQRIVLLLTPFIAIFVPVLTSLNRRGGSYHEVITFVLFLFMLLYTYAALMIVRRIRQLQRPPR